MDSVPAAARPRLATLFVSLCNRACSTGSTEDLKRVFALLKLTLTKPPRGGKRGARATMAYTVGRVHAYAKGDYGGLISSAQPHAPPTRPPNKIKATQRLVHLGCFGKACKLLMTSGTHIPHNEALSTMQAKNPPGDPVVVPPSIPQACKAPKEAVLKLLRSFPRGTSFGSLGAKDRHLLDLIEANPEVLTALTRLVNFFLQGEAPQEVAPFFAGGDLHAIPPKLRPVVVGNLFSRLTSRCSNAISKDAFTRRLEPQQVVVSRAGAEAKVHALRSYCELQHGAPRVLVQVDSTNAFNTMHRQHMLQQVAQTAPGAAAYSYWKYQQPSHLSFGPYTILSTEGTHQGDPLASAHYALGLHTLVEEVSVAHENLDISSAYADDWDLAGPPETVSAALEQVCTTGPAIGCHLNRDKCQVIMFDGQDRPDLLPGIPRNLTANFVCLGSPIGTPDFCNEIAHKTVEETRLILEAISQFDDSHAAFLLLRYCAAYPRMVFLMRTVPHALILPALQEFDELVRTHFCRIFNLPLSQAGWQQASLATRRGGLGFRSAAEHAGAAYLASVDKSFSLAKRIFPSYSASHTVSACAHLNSRVPEELTVSPDSIPRAPDCHLTQNTLSTAIEELQLSTIKAKASPELKARLLALQVPGTSTWLSLPPNPECGHWMHPRAFQAYLQYRLGLPIYPPDSSCPQCQAPMDCFGHHALKCKFSSDRVKRHNLLRNRFFKYAQMAQLGPHMEPRHLVPESARRPADILLPDPAGRDKCLDFAVTSTAQSRLHSTLARDPMAAVSFTTQLKLAKHNQACLNTGLDFVPMVVDIWGIWGQHAIATIALVAKKLAIVSGQDPKEVMQQMKSDLNNCLAVANAQMLASRFS